MTNNNVGILTFRVFAIYAVVRGLMRTSNYVGFLSSKLPGQDQLSNQIMIFVQIFGPLLLLIIFSVILWKSAPRLTNKIFTYETHLTESTAKSVAIISLVLSCIGLCLLIDAIAGAIKTSLSIYALLESPPVSKDIKIYMFSTILKFTFGFGLLLRSKELVMVLHKQRNE